MVDKPNGAAALADPDKRTDAALAEGAEPVAPPIPDGSAKPKKEEQAETPEQIAERLVAENKRLNSELKVERTGRQAAEARAAERTNAAFSEAEQKVETGLKATKAKREQLQRDYETALQDGDFKKTAQLAIEIGDVAVELRGWEHQQRQLEQSKARTTEARVDLNEQVISSLTAPAQRWMRQHPEFIRDGVLDFRMQAAHYEAIADGIEQDSKEYFSFIERKLGLTEDGERRQQPREQPTPRAPGRSASSIAAPPSRDTGSSRAAPENVDEVTLSDLEQEQAIAEHPELKPNEAIARYAKNKFELLREGAYERGAKH